MKIEIGKNFAAVLLSLSTSQEIMAVIDKILFSEILKKMKPITTNNSEEVFISRTELLKIMDQK